MTQSCGIDTSVLVRLVTAEPELDFQHCVESLRALIDMETLTLDRQMARLPRVRPL